MAADIVSAFLLDCDLHDGCSFEEFQQLFPSKYREHTDVKLLYRAFRRNRKIVRDAVQKSIENRYGDNMKMLEEQSKERHMKSIDTAMDELHHIRDDLKQEFSECNEEMDQLSKELVRFTDVVGNGDHLQTLGEECDHQTLKKVSALLKGK